MNNATYYRKQHEARYGKENVTQVNSMACYVIQHKGYRTLVSYDTTVAIASIFGTAITSTRYSTTTTKQITTAINNNYFPSKFDRVLQEPDIELLEYQLKSLLETKSLIGDTLRTRGGQTKIEESYARTIKPEMVA